MDKMKTEDAQLTQASGVTTSTDNDQSTVIRTTPTTNGSRLQVKRQTDHLGRACRSTKVEAFILM